MPILILFRVAALARFNLLHGYWRHSGVTDVIDIGKAVALGSLVFFMTTRYVFRRYEFPLIDLHNRSDHHGNWVGRGAFMRDGSQEQDAWLVQSCARSVG